MVLWCYSVMVLWCYGVMVLWCYGSIARSHYRTIAPSHVNRNLNFFVKTPVKWTFCIFYPNFVAAYSNLDFYFHECN